MNFTPEETETIHQAARAVWDYVAYDYLALNEGKSIKRAEVVEVVCDAGRLEQEIRKKDPDLAQKVADAGPELEKVVTKAFAYAWYGL